MAGLGLPPVTKLPSAIDYLLAYVPEPGQATAPNPDLSPSSASAADRQQGPLQLAYLFVEGETSAYVTSTHIKVLQRQCKFSSVQRDTVI